MGRRIGKRAAAALLAFALAVSLCACNGKDGDGGEAASGTVYVPTYKDIDMGELGVEYVQSGCSSGENLFLLCEDSEEKEETDPDTGETYTYYEYRTIVVRVPLEGGEAVMLENYTVPVSDPNGDSWASVTQVTPGADGTIWVQEYYGGATYDLPEDFDEANDSKYNYQTGSTETTVFRQLDATGNELKSVEVTDLAKKLELEYVGTPAIDEDGNLYVVNETTLYVLDPSMNKLFSLELGEGNSSYDVPVRLGDGRMGLFVNYNKEDPQTGESVWGYKVMSVDLETKAWGTEYALPSQGWTVLPGGGDYLFYFENGDSVYGYSTKTNENVSLFSWVASDINKNDVSFYTFLTDGRVVAVTQTAADENEGKDEPGYTYDLALLTATDASTLPEKTVLTFATMGLSYTTRNDIIEFNRSSDKYRIDVTDYSELNTGEDADAGTTKFLTEVGAGHVPDIMDTDGLPLRQLTAKGVLEDLWPYIENDPDLGRDKIMEHVLEVSEVNGILPAIYDHFSIQTVAGKTELVGDRMSWKLQDLQDALAQMPEGCQIFGDGNTKAGMLSSVMSQNFDSFVDWTTGKCSFDSDGFKALLEFCNSFPEKSIYDDENFNWDEYVYESEAQRIMNGKQMLIESYINSMDPFVTYDAMLGSASFVGYPQEDGSVGSSFSLYGGMAMSSTCKDKDGAWSFMRQLLLPDDRLDNGEGQWWYGIPVNKADFDRGIEYVLKEEYETDENGEQMLDENGEPMPLYKFYTWIAEEQEVKYTCATQEQVDQFMALYNAVEKVSNYDESIFEIITDQAQAYFAGDRDVDATAQMIQSRVELYVNEQR